MGLLPLPLHLGGGTSFPLFGGLDPLSFLVISHTLFMCDMSTIIHTISAKHQEKKIETTRFNSKKISNRSSNGLITFAM